MKKTLIVIIIVVILAFGYFNFSKIESFWKSKVVKGSEIISLDSTWNLYKNYDLGFQFKIPKTSGIGSCKLYIDEYGRNYYQRGDSLEAPIKVFEGEKSIYVAPEYEFILDGGFMGRWRYCNKVFTGLNVLEGNQFPFNADSWEIKFKKVNNTSEINQFVAETYKSGTRFSKLTPSSKGKDVYIVEVEEAPSEAGCPPDCDWAVLLYYKPRKLLVQYLPLGIQAFTFTNTEYNRLYDREMTKSFEFFE